MYWLDFIGNSIMYHVGSFERRGSSLFRLVFAITPYCRAGAASENIRNFLLIELKKILVRWTTGLEGPEYYRRRCSMKYNSHPLSWIFTWAKQIIRAYGILQFVCGSRNLYTRSNSFSGARPTSGEAWFLNLTLSSFRWWDMHESIELCQRP